MVVKLNENVVEQREKAKYLGVWIDEGLTWKTHIEAVQRTCFGGLAKLRRHRDSLPALTRKNIYNTLVLPSLDYCCVVWQECGKVLQQRLEQIQNYAMRLICSKPPRTPSEALRREMNWTPLVNRREIFRQVLVQRCVTNWAPKYLAKFYQLNHFMGHGSPETRINYTLYQ